MPPDDPPRGFRLDDVGALRISGGERIESRRYRTISVDQAGSPQNFRAAVYQHSDERGAFDQPPHVHLGIDVDRKDWEDVKRAVDRAFDEFERRWPQ